MSRYTAEEKQARIAEARDLLADLNAADELAARSSHAMPEPSAMQSFGLLPLLSSARSERFRREAEQLEAAREQEKKTMTDAQQVRRWQQWADARIAAALAGHSRATEKAVGQALGEIREQLREEFAEQLGQLRAEISIAKAHDRGQILDLPALPSRRRGHAA